MTPLQVAAREICDFLNHKGWKYCLVGGIAVTRWGEPRTTVDVDLCLLTGLAEERRFIDAILERFEPRIEGAAEFAEINRVLLINASNRVGIDIALGWTPFEQGMVSRAKPYKYAPNLIIPTASAEDVVITKAFAGRDIDWIDLRRLLARQRGKLDWNYIRRELASLAELREAPEFVQKLERLKTEIDSE